MTEVLRVEKVSKSYGHFLALKDVDLAVRRGERRAVIGPNGAGKSTLFNIIAGQRFPTKGRVYLDGEDTTGMRPDQMWSHGLTRTFQRNQLFQGLSVWENVALACAARHRGIKGLPGSGRKAVMETEIAGILRQVHLEGRSTTPVKNLAYGEQRQLELALALAGMPQILLLDEPTAGMSPGETQSMVSLMAGLSREITLLIVEHDMDVVFTLADSITVLHLGEVLAAGSPSEIQSNDQVRQIYMGGRGTR